MTDTTKTVTTAPERGESRLRHPFAELHKEVNRLFDDYSPGFPSFDIEPRRWFGANDVLAIDFIELKNQYEITAELSGLDEDDFDLTLNDHVLTLSGEKKVEREEKEKDYYMKERHFGSFKRTLNLPDDAETDALDASFKDGVLKILIPKSEEAAAAEHKIEIGKG